MKFKFSTQELKDLLIADIMLSIAFTIVFAGFKAKSIIILPMMFLVMTFSFIIHELAHKYYAQKFKYHAEFRANKNFLFITVLLSIFGFIIAAPGAVYISGHHNIKKHGIIAAAGPASNVILSIIFLILSFTTNIAIFYYIYFINAILAVFNMLPIQIFDGHKVWRWNKAVYIIIGVIALVMYAFPYFV